MRVLFLHQNFPGQFLHVAHALKRQGRHEAVVVTDADNARPPILPTRTYKFAPPPPSATPLADHYARRVARGLAVAGVLAQLRREGFEPDVVVGHGGWGETLFVKDVWPRARLILLAEFYYEAEGADVAFDPEFGLGSAEELSLRHRVRARNAAMAQALIDADLGVAATQWQASRFPDALRRKIVVLHEGIDTARARPDPAASIRLKRENVTLRAGDEVVTFVNRNFEPYRGYHIFMRALPRILAERPNAHAILIGGDGFNYGSAPPKGQSWRRIFFDEVRGRLDTARVHFVGRIEHALYLRALQISAAHVYLTYPFVLSWSMLEAMSAGAAVIGSATPPVEEVIEDGRNGMLTPFFDSDALAAKVVDALARPADFAQMRTAARRTVMERYDLARRCLPAWMRLIERAAG